MLAGFATGCTDEMAASQGDRAGRDPKEQSDGLNGCVGLVFGSMS
jgi:hypothetical protein